MLVVERVRLTRYVGPELDELIDAVELREGDVNELKAAPGCWMFVDDAEGERVAGDMDDGLKGEESGEVGRVCGEKVISGGGGGLSDVDDRIWTWSVSIYRWFSHGQ